MKRHQLMKKQKKRKIKKDKSAKSTKNKGEDLLEGLNFDNLKSKYKKNMEPEFNKMEIEQFDEENENELYKELEKK